VQSNKAIGGVALTIKHGWYFQYGWQQWRCGANRDLALGGGSIYAGMTANDTTNHSLTINNTSGSTTFSGIISNGPGTGAISLIKSGASTQILSGSNNYTGSTTINAGTLQLGDGSTTGSLSASSNITVNGTLAFNRSNDLAQGTDFSTSAISGTGSLVQSGTGNLTLNAANTYSGGTKLNSGTLVLNNASAIGNGTLTINGGTLNNTSGSTITLSNNAQNWNADFAFTGTNDLNMGTGDVTMNASRIVTVNGGTLTIGGNITGTGYGLTKAGAGTLTLSGVNTYSGTTTVNAGTLAFGANQTLGAIAGAGNLFLSTYKLTTNASSDTTFSGVISGTGGLTKNGTGTLTLSGANTYNGTTTVNAGMLALGSNQTLGAIAGAGNLSLSTYNLTTNTSSSTTLSGVVSGTGSLTLLGSGNLTLSGSNSFSGGLLSTPPRTPPGSFLPTTLLPEQGPSP
jgi:autotransporter-associated beta strand protein